MPAHGARLALLQTSLLAREEASKRADHCFVITAAFVDVYTLFPIYTVVLIT